MKDKRNFVIAALLIAVVMMSIGYATFASQLTISGTATVDTTSKWDVEIVSITPTENGGVSTKATSNATKAEFSALLKKPGESVTYDIVIKNKGTIDAKLSDVTYVPAAALAGETGDDLILYSVVSAPAKNSELAANGTEVTVTVKVEFNPNAEAEAVQALIDGLGANPTDEDYVNAGLAKDFEAIFSYVQKD